MMAASPRAEAAPVAPSGSNFKIWYYKTKENGERDRYFSGQDLTGYINRARCECGQDISTRVLLSPAMGGTYDNTKAIRTYVGSRCDVAVGTPQVQVKPCVKVYDGYANAYTKQINFSFGPVWLAGGIDTSAGGVDIGSAVPSGTCDVAQGDAGVWICIEDGMANDCQANEFQVTGTQNNNTTGTMTGGVMPTGGIHYDFQPPTNLPSDFSIDSGDGTVLITWKLLTTGDIAGYRVLCADADGNPLPGRGLDPPPLAQVNVGKLYFTKDNLCPEGPFGDDVPVATGSTTGTTTGTDTGGTDTDGTTTDVTDGTTGGVFGDGDIVDGFEHATTGSSGGTTTTTTTATDDGGGDPPVRDTDVNDTENEHQDTPSGIMTMDWAYVCSPHIGGTSQKAKVTGLENDREYQFAIVAYDLAGNPVVASGDLPLTASPRETTDLWEQCEIDGNVCGDGGFCNCSLEDDGRSGAAWLGVLAGFGARRRRRRGRG